MANDAVVELNELMADEAVNAQLADVALKELTVLEAVNAQEALVEADA